MEPESSDSTWPPPMPDASRFVAPPVPQPWAAVAAFGRSVAKDPAAGGRVMVRGARLAAIALICVPLQMLWRAAGRESPWAQRFLRWSARACGIRVRVIGQPAPRNVFYIANHLSWADALILGGCTGAVFVAQHGIAIWPGLGLLCRVNDTIFVNRSDRMGVPAQIAAIRAVFAGRSRVAMFAEGTTSDGRRLLPFKAPLFAMLVPPPTPEAVIQPVVIDCDEAGRNLAWIGMETGASNAWRLLAHPGTWEARVHFLEPFSPAETPDRKALSARARSAIAARLSETLGGRPVA